jgi:hypothetical protein
VRPQEQQQVIPGQLTQFLQRRQVDVQLPFVAAGVDEARQSGGGIQPGVARCGLDLVQALARILLRLLRGFTGCPGGPLQFVDEARILQD